MVDLDPTLAFYYASLVFLSAFVTVPFRDGDFIFSNVIVAEATQLCQDRVSAASRHPQDDDHHHHFKEPKPDPCYENPLLHLAVSIYQAEITPRRARGFVVGAYQLSLAIGGLVVNCVARRTSDIQSPAAT
ncbi:hypothetical protein BGZ61DRAFT_591612 [Ilyonectria robusta]|uniref:uncharacterized protein n=1 Tax=Ilyonectria robusta TaxID=1079257 RepID=UPI001E8D07A4|nr:uncharacterized protein BGZ61DRAFT_591612 [Ilyonectria robusta]KAH8673091.1 hypothetical protein BGZ61DRAFT_591612 [Ilyonectria robusta]